jgi:cell division GTPase FtsZ
MGGGTGTGASPIVARIAKEQGALVVGIVTKPFDYEGKVRLKNAQNGIDELMKNVDAIIVIPNQKIYAMIEEDTDIDDAMLEIDQILFNSTKGISDIINRAGKFNVDFADVRTIMKDKGQALMGIGRGEGKNRALEAATNAITSPLLEGISIKGAKGLLLNITGGKTISQVEIKTVINTIKDITGDDINLIYGVVKTGEETDVLSVTVIATGFDSTPEPQNQTPVIKPNHHPNPIFEIPPTPRVYSRQGTFFPNDVKTVNEEIPVSRVAQSFKPLNGGFETNPNNGTSSRNDSQIPKGHVLKEYDKPAIIRNTANVPNDYPAYQDSIGTTFETEQDVVEVTPELEEIQLDNYQQGYDIMSAPTSLERNNFSKYSY